MQRRPVFQTLLKALNVSSATAQVDPDLLKALTILSDTTVRRSAVHHTGNQKKGHISLQDQQSHHLQVFQRLY